jgi:hypothetical protein
LKFHDFLKNHVFQKKIQKKVKTFGKKNPILKKKNPYGFFSFTMSIDKMKIFF